MATPLSRLLALAALLPLALACDATDPRPDLDGPDPADEPPPPVDVDAEALALAFGCDVTVVALGEEAEGEFAEAPCVLDDGRAVAFFAFGLDEADTVTAEAGSAWFDTMLYLYDAEGAVLAENDDADWYDANSRLEAALDRGVYVAGLAAFDTTAVGAYRFMAVR
jgi:hypothetical protein